MRIRLIQHLFLAIFIVWHATAQATVSMGNDTIRQESKKEQRQAKRAAKKERNKNRNFHYNILGGPSYSPDYGLLIGGNVLTTFSTSPKSKDLPRSVLPVAIAFIFKGGLNVQTRPQLFFMEDRFRIFGQLLYKNTAENFYGIGYSTNKNYARGEGSSLYKYSGFQINPQFLFRIGESDFFVGPQVDLNLDKIMKPAAGIITHPDYVRAGGKPDGYKRFSSGLGIMTSYDTRDVPANAYKGLYMNLQASFYNKILGSDNNFYQLLLDYRQYKSIGERKTFAWTVQSKNMFGNVPLNKYALSGTPFDLRGYYMGQYRDKTSHVVIAEYRQMINTDQSNFIKKMLHRLGFVVWGGCGFMGPNPVKIEGMLPNLGAGIRIEVQPRMNIRLDFGRNMVNKQNLFYFNVTEAF